MITKLKLLTTLYRTIVVFFLSSHLMLNRWQVSAYCASYVFNNSDIFISNLILIITSLATHYSQNVFLVFFILVCIGVQVFCVSFFFTPPLALASRLPPFDRKTLTNYACSADPGLLNETKGSWFPLSCLSSYQNKWSKQTFFITTSTFR